MAPNCHGWIEINKQINKSKDVLERNISVNNKKGKYWHGLVFAVYLVVLCYFLFFAEMFGRTECIREYRYNLVLFKEIQRFWDNRHSLGFWAVFYNLAGNVLAFMPYGFYLPILFQPIQKASFKIFPGFFIAALFSLLFSLVVETTQLILKVGSFDVDDLLLNTLGWAAGYLAYLVVRTKGRLHEGA